MLDILEGLETQTGIPMIARLVKPLEGFGRIIETRDGYDFSCENDTKTFLLEFYDARYPDAYQKVGINGAFVTRYDLSLFSLFDDDTPYIDLDSTEDYRFSVDDFLQIIQWANDTKPLIVGRTDEMAISNARGYAKIADQLMYLTGGSIFAEEPDMDNEDDGYPIPASNGSIKTLTFTQEAQARRDYVSLGRNGWMKTIGIQVVDSSPEYVSMIPVNSREKSGRCEIQIPRDQGHLEAVIDMYQSILEGVKAGK